MTPTPYTPELIATGTPHPAAALEKAVAPQFRLPGQDAGIDFAREYELAKGMVGVEPKG